MLPIILYLAYNLLMSKRWKILSESSDDILEQLFINRGITTPTAKEEFLNPSIEKFQKELAISGIAKATSRIEKALKDQETIIIYGDYDVDGVCATAIMYTALSSVGGKVLPYIPHREKEGYGLSKIGLDTVREMGATLVVTVDQGIVALEQAEYAKTIGLDLIITDHHIPLDKKPECVALVHSIEMCGSAVAWCLAKALVSEKEATNLLDFVAIATICDMMPLLGVNRWFVKEGLKIVNKTDRPGLLALFRISKLTPGNITAQNISHIIGPRLNVMGRMEHAIDSLRLLCTKSPEKARKLAQLLSDTNEMKKQLTVEAISFAKTVVEQEIQETGKEGRIVIVHSATWIPGIIGLIAARLTDDYAIPSIAISEGEIISKGSARSVNGLNIIELMRKCEDLLAEVGGHPAAAGFSVETKKIPELKKRLFELMESQEVLAEQELEIEMLLPSSKISKKLVKQLEDLEPCGLGNPYPIFATKAMMISDIRSLSEGKHLKCKFDDIDAIAFSFGRLASLLQLGQLVDVAYTLELNTFNGSTNLQLKVVDIQLNPN